MITPPPGVTVMLPEPTVRQAVPAPGVLRSAAFATDPKPTVMAPARTVTVSALRTVISNSGVLAPKTAERRRFRPDEFVGQYEHDAAARSLHGRSCRGGKDSR